MSGQTWTMEFTKRDLRKLKVHKIMSFILMCCLGFAVLMMGIAGYFFVFEDNNETASTLLIIMGVIIFFLVRWVGKHYKKLRNDLRGGVKEAIQGEIEDKVRYRSNCEFVIKGETYHVNLDAYYDFDRGDHVLIAFAPESKVMLDIKGIEKEE